MALQSACAVTFLINSNLFHLLSVSGVSASSDPRWEKTKNREDNVKCLREKKKSFIVVEDRKLSFDVRKFVLVAVIFCRVALQSIPSEVKFLQKENVKMFLSQ